MKSRPPVRTRGVPSLDEGRRRRSGSAAAPVVSDKEPALNKRILLTQVIMTFLMATTMSGVMSLIFTGPSLEWLAAWPRQILIAWPIAFVATMVLWPASMGLAGAILRPRAETAPAEAPRADEAA